MSGRGQTGLALLATTLIVVGGLALDGLGARNAGPTVVGTAPTGAWFCPHGGAGEGWRTVLWLANPGDSPVEVRVSTLGRGRPEAGTDATVAPGTRVQIPVPSDAWERATVVEYFGGWVAAGWVARAGGRESGVAAEPCLPQAGRRWFLPDGVTEAGREGYVIVMNPFAVDAVVDVTLFSEKGQPVVTEDWSDVVLEAHRSVAFRLGSKLLGEPTVSALVQASVGRVVSGSLGVSSEGGVRSSAGILGPPAERSILPGGRDAGASDIVAMNPSEEEVALSGSALGKEDEEGLGGLQDATVGPAAAQSFQVSTLGATALDVRAIPGAAVVRRSVAPGPDEGAAAGAAGPAEAWVVLPATPNESGPYTPRIVLANPGPEGIRVSLSALTSEDGEPPPEPVTVTVPAGRTASAPPEFMDEVPFAAILVRSSGGGVVPAAASFSEGDRAYAVALGVPIPGRWIPG